MLSSPCIYAQTATGSCKLPGSYDYVKVGYYDDGHLAVSVQSNMSLAELHITVTCTATWTEQINRGGGHYDYVERSKDLTLCDKDFYNIPCCQTSMLNDGVYAPQSKCNLRGAEFSNYNVYVGNLICK